MKQILVVHYSQTGQLAQVAKSIVTPLEAASGLEITHLRLEPETPYPFPWPVGRFFDTFPECVYLDAPPLAPLGIDPAAHFDLVILCYQVWFLSPSLPVTAFLRSEAGRQILKGRPVVTVTACRNMWLNAQQQVRHLLDEAGARHLDHVALVDRGPAMATFYTTPRWLLTGHKGSAGVSARDIDDCARFGVALVEGLRKDAERSGAPMLAGLRAVEVDERLMMSERIGYRSFRIWGRLIRAAGPAGAWQRKPLLLVYAAFLICMILTVVPLSMAARALLKPLLRKRLAASREQFEQPSGSLDYRMKDCS